VDLNYERRGTGSPLVLIHGIAHRWQAWEPVIDALAAHHDVIAVDLPGFGLSPVPSGGMPPSIPRLAGTLGSFLASLGVGRPHVAGNSLGGALALELARSGDARSVTAFSPLGLGSTSEAWWGLAVLVEHRALTFIPEPVIRRVLATTGGRRLSMRMIMARPDRLSLDRCVGDSLAMRRGKGFRSVARGSRGYHLPSVSGIPVTVAWGARDRILLPRQAERARDLLPDARHVTLPGCGHVPMGDNPDLVVDTILRTTGAVVTG
jgi:pimeloyl-ACP methyl ester carboxylesterase